MVKDVVRGSGGGGGQKYVGEPLGWSSTKGGVVRGSRGGGQKYVGEPLGWSSTKGGERECT